MKQEEKREVVTVTTIAETTSTNAEAARQLREQYAAVIAAENNAFVQRVRLGGMLFQWEAYLGPCKGGRSSGGCGLKAWLETNLPELSYTAALNYKDQAKKVIALLGGGRRAVAALMGEATVTTPDGETVGVDARLLALRDELFEKVDSRRKLDQSYYAFMAESLKGRPGRKEGVPEAGGLAALSHASVVDGLFLDLTKVMALMRKYGSALMRHADAIMAKHPDECAEFAQLALDFSRSFRERP